MDAIENEGLKNETLIIFISDNRGSPLTGANNSPLTGGKYSLWEGGIRAPMAMSWPGQISANQIQKSDVSAVNILPAITKFTNIKLADNTMDGMNLLNPVKDRVLV
jgi:arylsulfatase A-like enzyme